MEWQIEGFTDKDYNVARRHANKGEDTCAYTVGMLIMELDAANEQIAKLKAVSPPSEGAGNAEKLIDELLATRSHDIVSFIDKQKWIKVASRYLSSPSPVSEERKLIDEIYDAIPNIGMNELAEKIEQFRSRSHT